MKIDHNRILNGNLSGHILWVTDLHFRDLQKKAIRNVPPTKVLVRPNSALTKPMSIYYSDYHLVVLGRDNKPTSKIIQLFDNTGYRSRTGSPVLLFTNEKDAKEAYAALAQKFLERVKEEKASVDKLWEDRIQYLQELTRSA